MKTIYKIALCLVAVFSFSQLYAQTYRVEAGYTQPIRYSSEKSHRYFHGVRLGVTSEYDIPVKYLSVQTGALGSFSWSKDKQKYTKFYTDSVVFNTKAVHLDIPVHIKATYKPHKEIQLFAFAGPKLNIGLYQPQNRLVKISNEGTGKELEKLDIKEGKSDLHKEDLRRFHLLLEAGAGIQWRKIALKGGYSFGINDLSRSKADKQREAGWYVSTSLQF